MNRKSFIKTGIASSMGFGLMPTLAFGNKQQDPEPIKVEIVKEFVLAGHFDLDKVKNMLDEEAIEGAGHKANKEVANYLIKKGARPNLFVLTMLGKTNLVKPTLEAFPNLVFSKGPHGLTLLHHAEIGGEESKELYDYLIGKGLTEKSMKLR